MSMHSASAEIRNGERSGISSVEGVPGRFEKLLAEINSLQEQKVALEQVLNGVVNSRSWKMTRPLRAMGEMARVIFPLFRRGVQQFEVGAGRNSIFRNGAVEPSGPSATFTVSRSAQNGSTHVQRIAEGLVLLKAVIEGPKDVHFFFLYYGVGGAFRECDRVLLPFSTDERGSTHLIRLPAGVTDLRLDPFDLEGAFRFKHLTIAELGSLQVLRWFVLKHAVPLLSKPRLLARKAMRAWKVYQEGGVTALRVKLLADNFTSNYQEWVERYDTISERDRRAIRQEVENLSRKPLISIVLPTYNTPERWLRAAIESVRSQLYPNWELCIADDASSQKHVRAIIDEYAAQDSRIKSLFRDVNGHISNASNSALELASGEYVALLDHDDELTEDALFVVAHEINQHPDAGLLYSDEDKITGYGMRFNPYFKSDWNPDLLRSQNYVCHLSVFRTDLVREVGGFRSGVEGAQDWDLILRVSEKLEEKQVRHIPHVLYHWRVIEGSTAQSTSYKPYVMKAQAQAVRDHLDRSGYEAARVEILEHISHLRVHFPLPKDKPLVSLIIPTRDRADLVRTCIESILERSTYPNFEIVLVDNGSEQEESLRYFRALEQRPNIRVVRDEKPFNFSRLNNEASRVARGELIGFINNDLEVIEPNWLSEMVSYALRKDVGAVGARLLFPNNLLQHGGIILGIGGIAGHNHKGRPRHDPGYFNRAILTQNLSAVTAACLIMRRSVFEEISGFNEDLSVAFNDVDLCLRIREKGYLVVYNPYAELYHYESASRGYENTPEKFMRFEREIERMRKRWSSALTADPYYNPNLTLLHEDFSFAFPPRVLKPWKKR